MRITDADIIGARTPSGWSAEILSLTEPQLQMLIAFYRKPFAPAVDAKFRELLQAGFRHLQIRLDHATKLRTSTPADQAAGKEGDKPSAIARKQFAELHRAAETMIERIIATQPATKSALAASARMQLGEAAAAGAIGRITELLTRLHEDSTLLAVLIERVAIEGTPGPADEVVREFVRDMIRSVHQVTGQIPGRSYQPHGAGKKMPGEGGPFVSICREMVQMAVARWLVEKRPKRPSSLTGIVRKELEAYRRILQKG